MGIILNIIRQLLSSYLRQGGEELPKNVDGALVALRDLAILVGQ